MGYGDKIRFPLCQGAVERYRSSKWHGKDTHRVQHTNHNTVRGLTEAARCCRPSKFLSTSTATKARGRGLLSSGYSGSQIMFSDTYLLRQASWIRFCRPRVDSLDSQREKRDSPDSRNSQSGKERAAPSTTASSEAALPGGEATPEWVMGRNGGKGLYRRLLCGVSNLSKATDLGMLAVVRSHSRLRLRHA